MDEDTDDLGFHHTTAPPVPRVSPPGSSYARAQDFLANRQVDQAAMREWWATHSPEDQSFLITRFKETERYVAAKDYCDRLLSKGSVPMIAITWANDEARRLGAVS